MLEAGPAGVVPVDNMKPAESVADRDKIEGAHRIAAGAGTAAEVAAETGVVVGTAVAVEAGIGMMQAVVARAAPHQT